MDLGAFLARARRNGQALGSTTVAPASTQLIDPLTGSPGVAIGFFTETSTSIAYKCANGSTDSIAATVAGLVYPIPVTAVTACGGTCHVLW